jgi:hypothetical protein
MEMKFYTNSESNTSFWFGTTGVMDSGYDEYIQQEDFSLWKFALPSLSVFFHDHYSSHFVNPSRRDFNHRYDYLHDMNIGNVPPSGSIN